MMCAADFLDDPQTPLASATDTHKGHGHIEARTAALTSDIAWLQESRPRLRRPPGHRQDHRQPRKATAKPRSKRAATC